MMISKKMNTALNDQIANEMTAAHKDLAMSYSFAERGLKVFARRFLQQSDEERGHALKIANYIHDVGGTVVFEGLAKPKGDHGSPKALVKAAVDSELLVTSQINDLVGLAEKEKDYATRSFLKWYVDEQVEEVSSMTELLQWVTMAGDSNILQVEARLAQSMTA
jgi:ferritin